MFEWQFRYSNKKIIEKLIRNLLTDFIIIIIIQYSHVSLFYEHVRVSMAENSSGHEKSNVRQLVD